MPTPHPVRGRVFACLAACLLLAGCGEKTEQQQLAALHDSFTYKRYRQLSEKGLPAAYAAWAAGSQWAEAEPPPPFTPETECLVHALLGYSALTANRGTLAIAEADIVDALPACSDLKQPSAALRAVAYQRLEWPQLAHEQSQLATFGTATGNAADAEQALTQALVIHAVLGYAALSDKNAARAQVHIDAIALILQQPWLGELGKAGLAIQQGDVRQGLVALKVLSNNPQVPTEVRSYLQQMIAEIEADTGDVDSSLWTARVFAMIIWREARLHGPQGVRSLIGFVDQQSGRLDQVGEQGKGMLQGWWNTAREKLRGSGSNSRD